MHKVNPAYMALAFCTVVICGALYHYGIIEPDNGSVEKAQAIKEPEKRELNDATKLMLENVITDPETGCQYFKYANVAPVPRLGRDGKPICATTNPENNHVE